MTSQHSRPCSAVLLLLIWGMAGAADWQPLVAADSLDGWQTTGGKAEFRVEGNEIVGVSVADSPNSFLVTRKRYSDFILEYESFVDADLNSGVQIRSEVDENGLVHGYQVEIDTSSRAFSGGVYDEQRRGWLYPLSRNEKGRSAFQNGRWNRFRVEAIDTRIRVWVNGVQTAALVDDMTATGIIGLQVHSIEDEALIDRTVRWRNLRILSDDLEANRWSADPAVVELSYLVNQLTHAEKRLGWRLLWDGKTADGWRGAKLDTFPERGWLIQDGILTVQKTGGGEATGPGDIVTLQSFSDFELELEFRLTPGANSGIKYFVDPDLNSGPGSAIGCEFQLLDDALHPDAKQGVSGNRTVGSLYDLIAAENLSVNGRAKQFKGIGKWNKARIVSRGSHVEHWLNNEKVVEYNRESQVFRALVASSKYRVWPSFGQWSEGRILLQDHGDTVDFRSIKIREW